jgi:hypothetical protein
MDDVTGAYGGHDYFNDHHPSDLTFYEHFLVRVSEVAALAGHKPFIIGEFGAAQHGGERYGIAKWDGCKWYDTDVEPLIGVQIAESVAAAINGGAHAMGYWTFADFPDPKEPRYANKWGTFRWSGQDYSIRAMYNAMGPLTRFFRGPADVMNITSSDPLVRTAAVTGSDGMSVVVVNRHDRAVAIELSAAGGFDVQQRPFRRYTYDPVNVRCSPFGDLPGPDAIITPSDGKLIDEVPAGAFATYTTRYSTDAPAAVTNVRVADGRLAWEPVSRAAYYRVYQDGKQIGSTAVTNWPAANSTGYAIRAVDVHGNAGV